MENLFILITILAVAATILLTLRQLTKITIAGLHRAAISLYENFAPVGPMPKPKSQPKTWAEEAIYSGKPYRPEDHPDIEQLFDMRQWDELPDDLVVILKDYRIRKELPEGWNTLSVDEIYELVDAITGTMKALAAKNRGNDKPLKPGAELEIVKK